MGFKVVKAGDVIDFLGCNVKVTKVMERGHANEPSIRFICLDKAGIRACNKNKVSPYFANAYKGSSLHPNERAQANAGKTACYSNWKELASQAFTALGNHCSKNGGALVKHSLGCLTGPAMANRCCANSNTIDECERRRSAGAAGCNKLRICKTVHSTGRASDSYGFIGATYCYPDPYDAANHNSPRFRAWMCWANQAHFFKINAILNEYWHWEWYGHIDTSAAKNAPEPSVTTDSAGNVSVGGESIDTETVEEPVEIESTNFEFDTSNSPEENDWVDMPDDYGSLEGVEGLLDLDRFRTESRFKGVYFLEDDVNLLSNDRFKAASNLNSLDSGAIIDGNNSYMTSIEDIWSQMPLTSDPKIQAAMDEVDELRNRLAKLEIDSSERKKALDELKIIIQKVTPDSDLEIVGDEDDELVKLISKYKETGNPLADSLQQILDDKQDQKKRKEEAAAAAAAQASGSAAPSTDASSDTSSNNSSQPPTPSGPPPTGWITRFKGTVPDFVYGQLQLVSDKFDINTPLRMAHFLAQCKHESANFRYTQELGGKNPAKYFSRYDGRMGNTQPGDGAKYHGRGYIQLTGKNNYRAFDAFVPEDVVTNPDIVATKYPLVSAAFWWKTNNVNRLADKGSGIDVVRLVSKTVNGGFNGIHERISFFSKFKKDVNLA